MTIPPFSFCQLLGIFEAVAQIHTYCRFSTYGVGPWRIVGLESPGQQAFQASGQTAAFFVIVLSSERRSGVAWVLLLQRAIEPSVLQTSAVPGMRVAGAGGGSGSDGAPLKKRRYGSACTIFSVAYSEHSSFSELQDFVKVRTRWVVCGERALCQWLPCDVLWLPITMLAAHSRFVHCGRVCEPRG